MKEDRGVHVDELKKLFYICDEGELRWRVKPAYNVQIGDIAGAICNGYRRVDIKRRGFYLHRIVWALYHGEWPSSGIDHINGIKNDNRIENLRVVTHQENLQNQKKYKNNKSGVPGVFWRKQQAKWETYIAVNYKTKRLGYFEDFFEAVCARKSAEVHHGFHANHGRTQ